MWLGAARERLGAPALRGALVVALVAGCGRGGTGELVPPPDAVAFEPPLRMAFDDAWSEGDLSLGGRAPHDVLDQRLLAARLGLADLVLLVEVEEVMARRRHEGTKEEFVLVRLRETLLGVLPRRTSAEHLIAVRAVDPIPGATVGRSMLLFVRWAPGASPGYHHHLMGTSEGVLRHVHETIARAVRDGALRRVEGGGTRPGRRAFSNGEASGS